MIPVATKRLAQTSRLMLVMAAFHVAGLVSGLMLPVHDAQAQQTPAAGMFLVASRDLTGSGFAESVILIIQHDAEGTMGLIVNQPTNTEPAELLSEIVGLDDYDGKLFIGGPVAAWGVIMLLHSEQIPANAERIFGNIYASGDRELLSRLINSGALEPQVRPYFRLFAGHSGWAPGQLDAEIKRGSWFVVPAAEHFIFSTQPQDIWQQLIEVGDRLIVNLTGGPHQKYTYNVTNPQMMPIRSGHFSSATP